MQCALVRLRKHGAGIICAGSPLLAGPELAFCVILHTALELV